jgi:serine/threonine-protein kinase RsbT
MMAQLLKSERLPLRQESDIVMVRQAVRRLATEQQFSLVDQTKIVTAASELARNAFEHGRGGDALLESLHDGTRRGLRCTFVDQGPGIADLQLALKDGYTTGKGLGLGLSGSKRLVNEFSIESRPGEGTTVVITRWR